MTLVFQKRIGTNFYADSYLAHREPDQDTLLRVKVIKAPFDDAEMKRYLQQQIGYLATLNIDDLAIPELSVHDDKLTLIYPFNTFPTLSDQLNNSPPLELKQVLQIGISLCENLEQRHKKTWIHQGIKPSNIHYCSSSQQVTLVDDLTVISPQQLSRLTPDKRYCKSSLAYQSPEQCALVCANVDYRSDLYSVGSVLYHCLAGHPPFTTSSPQQMIHSLLAEIPAKLEHAQTNCPAALSQIISVLLEKQTEQRYQTAAGLKQDLNTCLTQLANGNLAPFPLKRADISNEIVIPSIMMGRENEKPHC